MAGRISDFLVEYQHTLLAGLVGYLLIGIITPMVVHLLSYLVRPEWLR